MISRIAQGLCLLFMLASAACTEEEPRYCDAVTNRGCESMSGHHCNWEKRACEVNEAGAAEPDSGTGG